MATLPSTPTQSLLLLQTHRAARLLDYSPATLKKWRHTGDGPPYLKIGSHVRYDFHELLQWKRSQPHHKPKG